MFLRIVSFLLVAPMFVLGACTGDRQKPAGIMGKITELPELKEAEEKIDSLKNLGMAAELEIMIVPLSLDPADSSKNIGTAFIQADVGFDEILFYEVRFDQTTDEILSVKNTRGRGPL